MSEKKAYLVLENGMIFEGKSFGYESETAGEVVFTTSMVGYLETLTDPGFYGQIVVQTFPLIGNYGVIPADLESGKLYLNGYIVREWCHYPSNFRCEGDIDTFLKENKIPGLFGIDTRKLTKVLREEGVMNGKILYSKDNIDEEIKALKEYKISKVVEAVTVGEAEVIKAEEEKYNVVLWDLGAKASAVSNLNKLGCSVVKVPASAKTEDILAYKPDGIVISHGPGDPAENTEMIEEIKKVLTYGIPVFGTGMGHQLMALACGAETAKLKYGHRGGSQPVLDLKNDKIHITSQNHGYYVVSDTLPESAEVRFVNVNDKTCEGIEYKDKPAFSVQFCPEAVKDAQTPGQLYGAFVEMMKEGKNNASK